jgi:hypothetical protein
MANISLKKLFEAEDFKARSKETGKLVHFKSKDAYQAALKAGSHEDPKAKKDGTSKATKPNDMFGGDYAKDRGGELKSDSMATVNSIAAKTGLRAQAVAGWADENGVNLSKVSDALNSKKLKPMDFMTAISGNPGNKYAKDIIAKYSQSATTSKYDDTSYWELNKDDYQGDRPDWAEDNPEFTGASLDLIDKAISDEFGNDFSIDRQFGGGEGGFEGPMQIFAKGNDGYSISIGSNGQDGKFSIGFLEPGGEEAMFEPNYDALTGEVELNPQQAYKVTKALMQMPEVQKLLKGEMTPDEFEPIYAKLKSKFSKTKKESTKLTSMIKK